MSKSSSSDSGIGLMGVLGITFLVLKLCKVIDWSWWWVLLPFYGGLVVLLFFLMVVYLIDVFNK